MKRFVNTCALFGAPASQTIAGMRMVPFLCAMLLLVWTREGARMNFPRVSARPPGSEVTPSEPSGIGAGVVLDEHLLTNGSRDQDYNGGANSRSPGARTGPIGRVLDRALGFVDGKTCPTSRFAAPGWQVGHAFALGLLVFTPRELTAHEVVSGDRPYASLFF
jgi:hypothetical protein